MRTGVLACILSLGRCAVFRDTMLLNSVRVLTGLGGGFTFVAGGVLAAGVATRDPDRGSLLLGIFYAGPGLGIALSATFAVVDLGAWPIGWTLLATASKSLGSVTPDNFILGSGPCSQPERRRGEADRFNCPG